MAGLDQRLGEILRRIGQADRLWRQGGHDPEDFLLIASGGMQRDVNHPAWDPSWPSPTASDIDDLVDLGYLRTLPTNAMRKFTLTPAGREQAAVLADQPRHFNGGRAPDPPAVLDWLLKQHREAAERFDLPARLLDAAVASGFVADVDREALAERILDLISEGYLAGDVPDFDQATAIQQLDRAAKLRLTSRAYESQSAPASLNFFGQVVAGQIAAGNINNFLTFNQLLDRAEEELEGLEEVDEETKSEARGVLGLLRGRALPAGGAVVTEAGGQLLGSIIGQLIGLGPPPA